MQITADSMGVYTKVFSLSPYQNFDVIRQWSVQWCLMARPACLGKRDQILRALFNEKVATSVSHQNFVTFWKKSV